MKKAGIFLVFWIMVSACQDDLPKEKVPAKLIPPSKMKAFLSEIHEAEARVMVAGIRQDSASALFELLEKRILKKHGLDTGQVNQSIQYYNQNPEKLDSIYAEMLEKKAG